MGDHMEETAKEWHISREAQDAWALKSHQRAVAGWNSGFFDDLVIKLPELERDANPRADTSAEKLASLKPAFDKTSRSEEHTSELQSLMRISYAVFCLKKKKQCT